MFRLYLTIFLFCGTFAHAQFCQGTDQRPYLTDAERQEIAQRIENVPFAEGNVWTATKGDRVLSLIGTVHLGSPALDPLTDAVAPLLNGADALLVEATPEGERALKTRIATDPDLAFLTSGPTLIDLLPPDLWAEIAEAARARGIPGPMAAKFQPWFLSLSLAIPPCAVKAVASGALGLDKRLMAMADDLDIPVKALEDPIETIKMLSSDPLETQLSYLALGIYDSAVAEDSLATLMAQYLEGKHTASMETARILARRHLSIPDAEFDALFDEAMDLLLVSRNHAWMDRIEAEPGQSVVIAFGAAHLGGQEGVLSLLAARGYKIEPVSEE